MKIFIKKIKLPSGGGVIVNYMEQNEDIVNNKTFECPVDLEEDFILPLRNLKLHLLVDNYVGALIYKPESIGQLPQTDLNLIEHLIAKTQLTEIIFKGEELDRVILKGKQEGFNEQLRPITTTQLEFEFDEDNMRCYCYADILGVSIAVFIELIKKYMEENDN